MHQPMSKVPLKDAPVADLYQNYAQTILYYIRRHVRSIEDAEDLLLEVFIAALESQMLLTLEEIQQQAWLWRVAHNKVIDYHRRRARRSVVTLEEAIDTLCEDDECAPEQVALQREDQTQLRKHLATLPEIQQEILRLRFANGLRSSEIGQRLNKSDGAIRMLLSRTLHLLRKTYELQ